MTKKVQKIINTFENWQTENRIHKSYEHEDYDNVTVYENVDGDIICIERDDEGVKIVDAWAEGCLRNKGKDAQTMKDYSRMSDIDLAKEYQKQIQIMRKNSASLFRNGSEAYKDASREAAKIREEIDRRILEA